MNELEKAAIHAHRIAQQNVAILCYSITTKRIGRRTLVEALDRAINALSELRSLLADTSQNK